MVGEGRFELPIPYTPSKDHTKLDHPPTERNKRFRGKGPSGRRAESPAKCPLEELGCIRGREGRG